MSASIRRRQPCQQCGVQCQATPLEVMVRGGRGWRGHWIWTARRLCPPCQSALVSLLGPVELQQLDGDPRNPSELTEPQLALTSWAPTPLLLEIDDQVD